MKWIQREKWESLENTGNWVDEVSLKHPRYHVLNESSISVKRENSYSIKEEAERPLAKKHAPKP